MTWFRPTRDQGPDAFFFEIKVGLLLIGGGLGVAGMVTERSALVWLGIVALGAGIILRLVSARMNKRTKQD